MTLFLKAIGQEYALLHSVFPKGVELPPWGRTEKEDTLVVVSNSQDPNEKRQEYEWVWSGGTRLFALWLPEEAKELENPSLQDIRRLGGSLWEYGSNPDPEAPFNKRQIWVKVSSLEGKKKPKPKEELSEYDKMLNSYKKRANHLISLFEEREQGVDTHLVQTVSNGDSHTDTVAVKWAEVPNKPLEGKSFSEVVPSWVDFKALTQDFGTTAKDLEPTIKEIEAALKKFVRVTFVSNSSGEKLGTKYVEKEVIK